MPQFWNLIVALFTEVNGVTYFPSAGQCNRHLKNRGNQSSLQKVSNLRPRYNEWIILYLSKFNVLQSTSCDSTHTSNTSILPSLGTFLKVISQNDYPMHYHILCLLGPQITFRGIFSLRSNHKKPCLEKREPS